MVNAYIPPFYFVFYLRLRAAASEYMRIRKHAVGCSVFEEHHRAGIERERECTNKREGQKYGSHMLAIWLSGAANVTRTQ
jgi:hypothetical protein